MAEPEYDGLSAWQALRRMLLGPESEDGPTLNFDKVRIIAQRNPKMARCSPLDEIKHADR